MLKTYLNLLISLGITPTAIAKQAHTDPSTFRKYLKGECNLSDATLLKLQTYLALVKQVTQEFPY